ncbi:hypothetical protein [Chryseobacterium sp. MMS23-Vi53]|uniref:hypothetical protein n=1 Tax=Chryseobacterium sp. MMS23-Vi53 TaxID=3386644 RepID=UPI0039E95CEC
MKKMTISCVLFLAFNATYAQIGVNTPDPSATFDITAKNTTGVSTNVDGLLIPRVDRERAQNMLAVPTSTLIYVNNISTGTQTGTAVNIDDSGYYYFDETVWKKLNSGNATDKDSNIYNINGSLLDNRTVSQGNKTLAFTGTANNAFSVDGSTFSVDANANSVGIGTTAPGSKLSIIGNFALGTNYAGLSAPSNGAIIQGAVGIGTNNASPAKLRVVSQNDDVANEYHFDDYSGSTNKYNALRFHKSRGTVAAPANLNNGDNIGSIEFIPHFNGTVEPYHNGTGINALYEGNGTDNLTSLRFFTSGDMPYSGEKMRIDPKGNVGIGTSSPTNLLHLNSSTNGALKIVDGTQGADKVLTSDANGVATWKDLPASGGNSENIYTANGALLGNRTVTQDNKTLAFTGTAKNAFSIDEDTFSVDAADNKVGIGTTSPTQKFVVKGANAQPSGTSATVRIEGDSNHALDFGTFADSPYGSYVSSIDKNSGNGLPLILNPIGSNVGIGTNNPHSSAILELSSTTQGFLPPRMTTAQRDAIAAKAEGLVIYNTSTKLLEYFDGTNWKNYQ